MAASARRREDQVHDRIRLVLVAAGFDEALTLSVVEEDLSGAYSPWTDAAPLVTQMPILRRASFLRRSLVPSLLARPPHERNALESHDRAVRNGARLSAARRRACPTKSGCWHSPRGGDFAALKGVIEALVARLNPQATLEIAPVATRGIARRDAIVRATGRLAKSSAFWAKSAAKELHKFELRGRSTVAELKLSVLDKLANLVPQYERLAPFPAIERDLNLVVDEACDLGRDRLDGARRGGPILELLATATRIATPSDWGRRQEEHLAVDQAARPARARCRANKPTRSATRSSPAVRKRWAPSFARCERRRRSRGQALPRVARTARLSVRWRWDQ